MQRTTLRISARRSCSASSSTCPTSSTPAAGAPSARGCTTILWSRTADYFRAIDSATQARGGDAAAEILQKIADPDDELNRRWDDEHDLYVVRCLLSLVEEEFEPLTLQAFRRLALDGISGAEAARELGLSVSAVYVAKSRVLARIRQKAEGLID